MDCINRENLTYEYFYYQCVVTKKILLAKRNKYYTRLDNWCTHLDKYHPQMFLFSYPRFVSDEELQEIFENSTWPHKLEKIDSFEAEEILKSLGLPINKD